MIVSWPFYISNFMSCFVKSRAARHKFRAFVNCFLYKPFLIRIVNNMFGTRCKSVKYVRQQTMGRCVCVVDDKYFVKIFRNMSGEKLKNFEFLVNYISKFITIKIPRVYIAKNNHMYITKKIPGFCIHDFDKEFVLKHEKKILIQVDNIISQLQSIDLTKLPNAERFCVALESTTKNPQIEPITADSVLGHFDMNVRNFLFDKDMNICGWIDFDSLHITNDKTRDKQIFMKYWNRYKENN